MEEKEILLNIQDYTVEFHTETGIKKAINHLNLTIHKGESLGLVGEAGAGKTTTALSILRLLPRHSAKILGGVIEYHGNNMADYTQRQMQDIRGEKISMIFQNPLTSLNPVFPVGEQIAMVIRRHRGMKNRQALEEAGKLMEMVGIAKERIGDYPHQFSGGMRQRIGIAAALACSPELLIADEPTTALDVTIQAQIMELMKELQTRYDTSLLMITHNLGIISELCKNVAVMYAGAIIEYGSVKEVFSCPQHPYTRGLLGAIPSLDSHRKRLAAIPGEVANPYYLPAGCSFHPRCQCAVAECSTQVPPVVRLNENHYVGCFGCQGEKSEGGFGCREEEPA